MAKVNSLGPVMTVSGAQKGRVFENDAVFHGDAVRDQGENEGGGHTRAREPGDSAAKRLPSCSHLHTWVRLARGYGGARDGLVSGAPVSPSRSGRSLFMKSWG